jgi:hypothetical protein
MSRIDVILSKLYRDTVMCARFVVVVVDGGFLIKFLSKHHHHKNVHYVIGFCVHVILSGDGQCSATGEDLHLAVP